MTSTAYFGNKHVYKHYRAEAFKLEVSTLNGILYMLKNVLRKLRTHSSFRYSVFMFCIQFCNVGDKGKMGTFHYINFQTVLKILKNIHFVNSHVDQFC